MRRISSIRIIESFVHILDQQTRQLHCSDFPIELDGNQPLSDYFTNHLRSSLRDPVARAAQFQNINPHQPSGVCMDILAGRITLMDGSRSLALSLHNVIRDDGRISSADLAVCLFEDLDRQGNFYLGILKIDPSEVFEHEILSENGRIRIRYQLKNNALTKEKLQKCAVIRPLEPRNPQYDMLLLDKQSGEGGDGMIARFFARNFLDTVETFDTQSRTNLLYNILVRTHNEIRNQLPEAVNQELDQRIPLAVNNQSINVENWLGDLRIEEDVRDRFREALHEKGLVDVEFDLDPQFGERLTRKVNFVGDYGFKISIPFTNMDDVIRSVRPFTDPDGQTWHEITIHTRNWNQVTH
jgi:hypothetical protein